MDAATNDPPQDLVGSVIDGRYRIEQRLSQGGMGVVYRARHAVLDSALAVKVLLRPQDLADQQRFLQEAKLASVVSHPNTVQIVDFGVLPSGQSYLVMELLRGRTLASDIKKGPMDALRVCRIGAQIARGLQAVHDRGIVHRDMKPDNVFLLTQDRNPDFVKIVDFGIAKAGGATDSALAQAQDLAATMAPTEAAGMVETMAGLILGTPPYMSPEQCKGGIPVDARADQYAVGCILYEMLAGERPYVASSLVQLLMSHIVESPPPLAERAPQQKIPPALQAAVMRMLQKEPAQRFPSMSEVAESLEQVADLLLVERGEKTVLPAGLLGLLGPRVQGSHLVVRGRRVPLWAVGAALLTALVAAFGGFVYFGTVLSRERSPRTLEPGELQAVKQRAVALLRQRARSTPTGPGAELRLRLGAIAALGQTQDAELRPELQALLAEPDEAVQAEAAAALGHLGDRAALAALRTTLAQARGSLVRLTAARALLDLGEASGEERLVQALTSGAPEERLRAASMLCDRRNAAAEKLLLQVVDEGLLQEESAVLDALGCLLSSQSAEAARERLHRRLQAAANPQQQIELARVLSRAGDEQGRRVLRELAARPGLVRLPAARALAAPDVPEVAELFRGVLRDRQAQDAARILASEGLGQSGHLLDVRLLDRALRGAPAAELAEAAAVAVLQLGAADPTALGTESLRWARGSLGASDWRLRESAALVLGSSATGEAVTLLKKMLSDSDARVRRGSVSALGRRTEESALLALREALRDPDPEVRLEALRSLQRISRYLMSNGASDVPKLLSSWFAELLRDGRPREQILARTLLLRLGDASQAQALRDMQHAEDAGVRRFLLEQGPADVELARALLKDADAGVRFAAARRLAEAGDSQALAVLHETLQQNGADSIAAYGLLARLGQHVAEPEAVRQALQLDRPVPERMAAIEAMSGMPTALAVPLLLQAARDPEPLVRRLCAEVAAELPEGTSGGEAGGFPVLRFLLRDRDPAVRQRAAALLSRLTLPSAPPPPPAKAALPAKAAPASPATAPQVSPEATDQPPADAGAQAGADPAEAPEPEAEEGPGQGTLLLDAPEGILFQIDGGKWQRTAGKGLPLSVGPHRVITLGGEYDFSVEPDKKVRVKLTPSPVDEAVQFGSRAYQQKEFSKAQKQYDRANALCSRDRAHKKACTTLELTLALDRGRIFEEQKRLSEAMAEYQKAVDGTRGKPRVQAAEALSRLAPQLGKVILRSLVKGKCQERVQWLLPGKKQKIKVGDKSQPVNVRAGQTVEIGTCS